MTQEDKNLLLKDLCARLPYNVCVKTKQDEQISFTWNELKNFTHNDEICKPYLRPMSSMTEEEKHTYLTLRAHALPFLIVEWLDKNHFDHRTNNDGEHLIEIGLALEAPEGGMYK